LSNIIEKTFITSDSLHIESLSFINDSICIYLQEFKCDIDEKFRKTEIKCRYTLDKNQLILENITDLPSFLEGKSCYRLPDDEIEKCDFIMKNTPDDPFIVDKRSGWTKANFYGFINNINKTDTLIYSKNGFLYAKSILCFNEKKYHFLGKMFHEKDKKRLADKEIEKIFSHPMKVPVNR